LVNYLKVGAIVSSDKYDVFTNAIRGLSEKAEEARELSEEIAEIKSRIDQATEHIEEQKTSGDTDREKISELLETSQELSNDIEQLDTKATATAENIDNIGQTAEELKVQIEAYREVFTTFQSELDLRNELFSDWSDKTKALIDELESKNTSIEEMIGRADDMLKGATNAGLATTFKETLGDIDGKLGSARKAFYWAIGFLAFSAIPLGAYLILSTLDMQTDESKSLVNIFNPENLSFSTTVALALLMVPTIWLTKFSAARYHQLFQLKEHYQYKYTLAMAVDGFKKQAPEHADEIAAETFFQLSFNPADKLSGKNSMSDHPSPLMNWIMNKLGLNERGSRD